MMKFKKLNENPIEVVCIDIREDESVVGFGWNGKTYFLEDCISCDSTMDVPDYIHGYHVAYMEPLFIEITKYGKINVYEEVKE